MWLSNPFPIRVACCQAIIPLDSAIISIICAQLPIFPHHLLYKIVCWTTHCNTGLEIKIGFTSPSPTPMTRWPNTTRPKWCHVIIPLNPPHCHASVGADYPTKILCGIISPSVFLLNLVSIQCHVRKTSVSSAQSRSMTTTMEHIDFWCSSLLHNSQCEIYSKCEIFTKWNIHNVKYSECKIFTM